MPGRDPMAPVRERLDKQQLRVRPPAHALAPWLRELRRRRAEAIWDGGLRPDFRAADGTFDDPDPHDPFGFQLVQTSPEGVVIGGVRLSPLEELADSRVRQLNREKADALQRAIGFADTDVIELGRLWIAPAWRGAGLGTQLVLAASGLGRVLGRRMLWGTVGARHGEAIALKAGWRIRPEFGRREEPVLADTLRVAITDPFRPPAALEAVVAELADHFRTVLQPAGESDVDDVEVRRHG